METATKNKRGRPKNKLFDKVYIAFSEKEKRAAQNFTYAACVSVLFPEFKDFFWTDKGNPRRQGIAEQIGRIYAAGLATDEETKELIQSCIEDYWAGRKVKEIESSLRFLRLALQNQRGKTLDVLE